MTSAHKKIAGLVAAGLCFVAGAVAFLTGQAEVALGLFATGGTLAGGMGWKRPGDTPPTLPVLAFILLAACQPGAVSWPDALRCVDGVAGDVLDSVKTVLLKDGDEQDQTISERAKGQLVDLARKRGPGLVACAVDLAVKAWKAGHPDGTWAQDEDPLELAAASRGEDFLRSVGAK